MSEPRRSFGVSFFAVLFILGSILSILVWGSPILFCLTHPEKFIEAFQYLTSGKYIRSLYFLYENTFAFAYLFVGFGLWRLKPWAYRLLLALLVVECAEKIAFVGWLLGTHRISLPMVWHEGGVQLIILFLLLLFFRRGSIREQFSEEASREVSASVPEKADAASASGIASSGQVASETGNLGQTFRQQRRDQEQARDELVWLYGIEIVCVCLFILAGVYLGWKQKIGLPKLALYGSLWAVESYLMCFYFFRARKLSILVGGSISIVAGKLLQILVGHFEKIPGLSLAANLVSILLGGFVGGKLTRINQWFHGSSAGVVWAVAQIAGRVHQKYGIGLTNLDKLNLSLVTVSLFMALGIGILASGLGGFWAGIKLQKKM